MSNGEASVFYTMILLSVGKITDFLKIQIQVQFETMLKEIQLLVGSIV